VLKELGVPHDPPSIRDIGNLRTVFSNPEEVSFIIREHFFAKRIIREHFVGNFYF